VWEPHPGASGAEVGAVSVPVWGLGLGLSVGPGSVGAEAWAPGVRIGVGDLAWTSVRLGEGLASDLAWGRDVRPSVGALASGLGLGIGVLSSELQLVRSIACY
jgi:hypothetical protein